MLISLLDISKYFGSGLRVQLSVITYFLNLLPLPLGKSCSLFCSKAYGLISGWELITDKRLVVCQILSFSFQIWAFILEIICFQLWIPVGALL